jgi:hypothetical protein
VADWRKLHNKEPHNLYSSPDIVRVITSGKIRWDGQANTRVYPKVSGLAAWSENCKWYSYMSLNVVVSLFCESV